MARSLKTLIRLNEWTVDQKRRKLGGILRLINALQNQAQLLEEELIEEQASAANDPSEAGFLYGNYANHVIERRERIALSIQQSEQEAEVAREELNEAYRELKKYETAQKNREVREQKELAVREQMVLDEIGLQGYARKKA
ncbi:MAG: flagellar FliJ family protein [Rhodospirillaceae bacterium]|jgi:flagellar protein FliJ|nr:flagellar FliJ family protein [Rhodospirillaceae bacterium]MBT4218811.1 flagellar FliJ family protein [Rhodospirillaceae bacterium]MBT4463794.1 flagellar FliJ family protein [Rhodospirillaceae bacterium]MBT5013420.1 flagellar FliJ family protein [Rhodospirillaceae bacterium]MBT5308093.1 flagellar FliJ family protein [Rhodospirillaceae bacterium]